MTINIENAVIVAILGLFGIGLTGIIQTLKTLLKWDGTKALLLTGACSIAATAGVLLTTHAFAWLPFLIYSACVFGEASGLYKIVIGTSASTAEAAALNVLKYMQRVERAGSEAAKSPK